MATSSVRVDYQKLRQTKMRQTMRQGLKERQSTPLALTSSEESLNSMSLETNSNVNSPVENSKPCSHLGSGYNVHKDRSMSPKHNVFVLGVDGNPLTPTTSTKAYKLLKGKVAKPVWNKFGRFGIQMLVETRKEIPKTALGIDFGTKFEGYTIVVGKENNLSVMWKLPNKKKIVAKLTERSQLRRARRQRNCRRREKRFNNRNKDNFIAPSQLVMVQSRLKALQEFFKRYPIDAVAMEDVKFNHSKKRYGKNFSTVEIGKKKINDWITQRAYLYLFNGYDTEDCRKKYGYKKSSNKDAETFNSHCSDALAIAVDVFAQEHIPEGRLMVVDDTYRPVRRRLHDTEFAKGGIREKYSTGNFRGVRKGTICEHGQIVGGTKKLFWIRNRENKRIGRTNVDWFSKSFKTEEVMAIPFPLNSLNLEGVSLPTIK